ncbi:hypothetical protein AVEN_188271-1 [Araneus ventricosus]|uniref:Uncharacterized protein n=1 Tax=Araneus ventricosus TaxID=182803 RepID=A0A4Y2X0J5_ARAVE|nr:hypothetical protein AVEN_188271-1 [Araneus ventricosus]
MVLAATRTEGIVPNYYSSLKGKRQVGKSLVSIINKSDVKLEYTGCPERPFTNFDGRSEAQKQAIFCMDRKHKGRRYTGLFVRELSKEKGATEVYNTNLQ